MSFADIPDELKALNQWLCWRAQVLDTGKTTKIPYNPISNQLASATDPSTWVSFEVAAQAAQWYDGIGFVFTKQDPYCGIDLDEPETEEEIARHNKILELIPSYTERSPSGKGMHVIVKADVPVGRKRKNVEIYSYARYFTFTGNVVSSLPVTYHQDMVTKLWEEMGSGATANYFEGWSHAEMFSTDVIEKARHGKNGALFEKLWSGDWSDYPSQSDADQALTNIIVFYTKYKYQAAEIFRMSGLGQRDKAKRDDYVYRNINKAFDLELPPIDLDDLFNDLQQARLARVPATPAPPVQGSAQSSSGAQSVDGFDIDYWRNNEPPGLMRLMQDYTFAQSPRPIKEIALVTAFGLISGIAGRAYNISGTGLNQYLMLLAPTGRGKEAIASGINRAIYAAANGSEFPALWTFLGPSDMASGSGLLKHLAERETPSFVSLTGEIGLRLQQMSNSSANMADVQLRRVLLDLYTKSGAGQVVRPTVYSDKKNNVELINSPAFTWLGESTPTEFYKSLEEDQISSGLIPRFTVIEYDGPRPEFNEKHDQQFVPQSLVKAIQELGMNALSTMQQGRVINVGMTEQAVKYARIVNQYADQRINSMPDGPLVQIWNRHHLKVLKTAALLAVSNNSYEPCVDGWHIEWANSLIMTGALQVLKKFEAGETGAKTAHDGSQINHIVKIIGRIMRMEYQVDASTANMLSFGVIPKSLVSRNCLGYSDFKNDRRGANSALNSALKEMVEFGWIRAVSKPQAEQQFKTAATLYAVVNHNQFLDN